MEFEEYEEYEIELEEDLEDYYSNSDGLVYIIATSIIFFFLQFYNFY